MRLSKTTLLSAIALLFALYSLRCEGMLGASLRAACKQSGAVKTGDRESAQRHRAQRASARPNTSAGGFNEISGAENDADVQAVKEVALREVRGIPNALVPPNRTLTNALSPTMHYTDHQQAGRSTRACRCAVGGAPGTHGMSLSHPALLLACAHLQGPRFTAGRGRHELQAEAGGRGGRAATQVLHGTGMQSIVFWLCPLFRPPH